MEVSADLCGPFPTGEYILVVLDAYSRHPEIEIVKTINTATITFALERIFATHGILEEIKTDNGAPFQGKEFAEFSKEKGVTPLWPEASGQVQNIVKNIGKVVKTAHTVYQEKIGENSCTYSCRITGQHRIQVRRNP